MRAALAFAFLATPALAQPERIEAIWAEPGMLRNPVAICFDAHANLYVAETDRAGNAVQDTRNITHLNAVEEDLRLNSVEDRLALINKWLDNGAFDPDYFTRTEDRVRRLADTDGDGVADQSVVYAGGFNDPLDGIAAGVLWLDDALYFTNIPNLWRLTDEDNDGVADSRESLSYGYGVRWCFYGHDLHGLTLGPDGRIYFSIGDRGFNVTTQEGNHLVGPQTGGVFRCWPDGSDLELFYQGLRNPQELAFDRYGNLFTGDNNCDSGDKARIHHIVEGGDSGWRQDVQSLDSRGPWNREHIWELVTDYPITDPARPAWTIPPVAHVGAGPSGFTYYPGVGESHDLDDHMIMVDFYGSGSTLHSFKMEPAGAWFTLTDLAEYYKGKTVTDIAWGPDGRLYLSDWGGGWEPNENGHVFTITNKTVHDDPAEAAAIAEVGAIIKTGFNDRAVPELIDLLVHRDQRVRLGAQYEIATRGARSELETVAASAEAPLIQRVHAIWALGQIARHDASAADPLRALATDLDPEIRTQSIKLLGDLRIDAPDIYLAALNDDHAQTRFYAALALGKIGHTPAIDPLLALLDANDNADPPNDPMLRHAASYALYLINRPDALIDRAASYGPAARLGIVLALRRHKSIGLSLFLSDDDLQVAIEAARAIYDENIELAIPALARMLDYPTPAADRAIEPLMRRVIEANAILGDAQAANRLAYLADRKHADEQWRVLALQKLAEWSQPIKREGVWGHWVDLPARNEEDARGAYVGRAPSFVDLSGNEAADAVLADLRARYEPDLTPDKMFEIVADADESYVLRANLLMRLSQSADGTRIAEACRNILDDESSHIVLARLALIFLCAADESDGLARILEILQEGPTELKQLAIGELDLVRDGDTVLARLAEAYRTGTLDPALALDVLEAAELLTTDTPSESAFGTWPTSDLAFAETILSDGGDPANGRDLFLHHETAQCLRCHTIDDLGGTAGPNLTHIASRLTKPEIIESLINPHARISPGYATLALTLKTGESISATIVEQDADKVVIDDAGHNRTIPRAHIRAQAGPVSAMPVMPQFLSPYEARDLVAYLVTLVDPALGPATTPFYAAPTAARADETAVLLTAGAVVRLAVGTFVGFAILAVIIALVLVRISRATA